MHSDWKESKSRGGYGLEVPCQYSSKRNSLAVRKWLSERIAKEWKEERKVVEDALARNQEREKPAAEREQQRNTEQWGKQ